MRKFKKNIWKDFFVTFLLVSLLIIGGCTTENIQSEEHTDISVSSILGKSDDDKTEESSLSDSESEKESNVQSYEDSQNLVVQFLDVGQGSSALLQQGDMWMLIDGGDRDYASYVVNYLKNMGITTLDYVVATHYDADHLGGIVGVLKNFECKQVLAADYQMTTKLYREFLDIVDEKDIEVIYPKLGDIYEFADSSFRIVAPAYYGYEDSNSNSIGIRMEYGENSFLISGDCTEESEQDLLYQNVELDSDVFAINHHGSVHSNTEEFLEAVSPEYVVISCGAGNSYGHPHAPVMLRIQNQGSKLYRTDLQGVITAVSDGTNITFENEVCMDYRSGSEVEENPQKPDTFKENTSSDKKEEQYVINVNTKKFHLPDCSSAIDTEDKNKEYVNETREKLIKNGYVPCKRCNP